MTKEDKIIALAKLDGYTISKSDVCNETCRKWYLHYPDKAKIAFEFGMRPNDEGDLEVLAIGHYPPYLTSRNDIVPLVEKWILAEGLEASIGRSSKFSYALYAILDRDNPHKTEAYPYTYILVIAAKAEQIAEALIECAGLTQPIASPEGG